MGPRGSICWVPAGSISGTFDAAWGTSGWNYLTQVGTVDHDLPFMSPLGNIGSNARDGTGQAEGQAIIELIATDQEGRIVFLVMFGPPSLIAPDTTVPIDWLEFGGIIGRAEFLDPNFQTVGVMIDGVLSFEAASVYVGERITGSFQADVIAAP